MAHEADRMTSVSVGTQPLQGRHRDMQGRSMKPPHGKPTPSYTLFRCRTPHGFGLQSEAIQHK